MHRKAENLRTRFFENYVLFFKIKMRVSTQPSRHLQRPLNISVTNSCSVTISNTELPWHAVVTSKQKLFTTLPILMHARTVFTISMFKML